MQKNELNIALIQANLLWEQPTQNLLRFEEKINAISQEVDLIILPEMFTTGFTMNAQFVTETMQGNSVQWMQQQAQNKQCAIVGSLVIKENGNYYNRLLFVHPNQEIETYDKRHLFTLVGEEKVYTQGTKQLIVNYKGWEICPQICYDLRFPVWSRNTQDYDLLLYVANWPQPRIEAWKSLLQARAIENMTYTIGVNRVGQDATKSVYTGDSLVFNCFGKVLANAIQEKEATIITTVDKAFQDKARTKFGFLNDQDQFTIQ